MEPPRDTRFRPPRRPAAARSEAARGMHALRAFAEAVGSGFAKRKSGTTGAGSDRLGQRACAKRRQRDKDNVAAFPWAGTRSHAANCRDVAF